MSELRIGTPASRRRRRGLSLVEIAMGLAILAGVVAGVLILFQNASDGDKTAKMQSQVGAIQQAVRAMYTSQPNFSGLNNSMIKPSLPNSMQGAGTAITNAFNGTITVAPANSNANFTMVTAGLPATACAQLAATDLGRATLTVKVGTNAAIAAPASPAVAGAQCTAASNTVTWTFR